MHNIVFAATEMANIGHHRVKFTTSPSYIVILAIVMDYTFLSEVDHNICLYCTCPCVDYLPWTTIDTIALKNELKAETNPELSHAPDIQPA